MLVTLGASDGPIASHFFISFSFHIIHEKTSNILLLTEILHLNFILNYGNRVTSY